MKNNFDRVYITNLFLDDGNKCTVDWVKELGDYPITRQMNYFRDKYVMFREKGDYRNLNHMLNLYTECWFQIMEGYKDFSYDAYMRSRQSHLM